MRSHSVALWAEAAQSTLRVNVLGRAGAPTLYPSGSSAGDPGFDIRTRIKPVADALYAVTASPWLLALKQLVVFC